MHYIKMSDNFPEQQLGSFELGDQPSSISGTSRFHSQLFVRVEWQTRPDGVKPIRSYEAMSELRKNHPHMLIDYLIGKIKTCDEKEPMSQVKTFERLIDQSSKPKFTQMQKKKKNKVRESVFVKEEVKQSFTNEQNWRKNLTQFSQASQFEQNKIQSQKCPSTRQNTIIEPLNVPHPKSGSLLDLSTNNSLQDVSELSSFTKLLRKDLKKSWLAIASEININTYFM